MAPNKWQDEFEIIKALLSDIQKSHVTLLTQRNLRNTVRTVERRLASEGIGFLTKTLPKLGKALDRALAGDGALTAESLRLPSRRGSKLPMFMGELLSVVLDESGVLLPDARAEHVLVLRQLFYLFYKYELPYSVRQEQAVVDQFVKTEDDLSALQSLFPDLASGVTSIHMSRTDGLGRSRDVVKQAKTLLSRAFSGLDLMSIVPSHGPGAVATRQQLWEKFEWKNISDRITKVYHLDAFFYASLGHFCDALPTLNSIGTASLPAKVILVPKDSRGPRLISCEPVDFQWIQQGMMRAIIRHIEHNPLIMGNVHFTDQQPNQRAALIGSRRGDRCDGYATLDLKEASDRVSLGLVRLLFPPHICEYLEAARTDRTVLPNGEELLLQKFAPMGSALCFPVMALTIWAILTAGAPDRYTRERILVYGDDVIVPTAYAGNAMELLELFGLKINRSKSCIKGSFRESCGMDAFKGVCVTPIKFRSVWSSSRSSETYTSWVAYANSMYDRGFFATYDKIVSLLVNTYSQIPADDMHLQCPSLREVPELARPKFVRTSKALQKRQWLVWDIKAKQVIKEIDGWSMLLRYFTEARSDSSVEPPVSGGRVSFSDPFSVRTYTPRKTSLLVQRWR